MYDHVLAYAMAIPWAIRPEKLTAIAALLEARAAGDKATADEIVAAAAARRPQSPQGNGSVAVINVYGTILPRANLFSEFSGGTSAEKFASTIRAAASDPSISAIVLDVDSPGGAVEGIEEAAAAVHAATSSKPVVAVANTEAASAAYWIAAQATEFVASPSSLVGSIGVLAMHRDLSGALEAKGERIEFVTAGKYKVENAPTGPLSDDARAHLQGYVDSVYGTFVSDVARGRGVSLKTVREDYGEGRVYTSREAVARGMVDGVETLDQVLTRLTSRSVRSSQSAARSESGLVAALSGRLRHDELAHALDTAMSAAWKGI
jgi:capsid assembly protease